MRSLIWKKRYKVGCVEKIGKSHSIPDIFFFFFFFFTFLLTIHVINYWKLRTKEKWFLTEIFSFCWNMKPVKGKFDIRGKLSGALDKGANIRNLICPLCRSFGQRQDIKGISDITNGQSMCDELVNWLRRVLTMEDKYLKMREKVLRKCSPPSPFPSEIILVYDN